MSSTSFSERARAALQRARSSTGGADAFSAARLLAALLEDGDSAAVERVRGLGLEPEALIEAARASEGPPVGAPVFTFDLAATLEDTLQEPARIGTHRLLESILQNGDRTLLRNLARAGLTADRLRLTGEAETEDDPGPSTTMAETVVSGLSIGGVETCIDVPSWKLAFDIGRCPSRVVSRPTILFTHAHMDHMGGVAWHCATRSLRGMEPPTYIVPRENEAAFEELFDVWRKLDRSDLEHRTIAISPGEEQKLSHGRIARPFRSPHRVVCQGYSIWETKRKLRPEYRELSAKEIQNLVVEDGVEVSEEIETPVFAFTGDTKIEVVEREEVVRQAHTLVMETTFVDDRVSVEDCRAKGHIHLFEVAERAELFQNKNLVLTHFSSRYTRDEIVRGLDEVLPPDLRARTTPLLRGHRKS